MRRKSLYVALYSFNYFKNFMSERDPNKWNNEKIRKEVFLTKKAKKQKLKVIFLNWVKIENVIILKCSFVFVVFFFCRKRWNNCFLILKLILSRY